MEDKNNVLAFTVNEALLLDKGQGIEEMLAISLEPDIVIETYHDYVQIRGIIILQGEYKKAKYPNETENESMMNYIEKIIDTEPGQAMFSHRFPVEISIPKNRIFQIEDVHVEVASFDYELPSTDCLNINATLHIDGISKGEVLEKAAEENVEESSELEKDPEPEQELTSPSETEIVNVEEEEEEEEVIEPKEILEFAADEEEEVDNDARVEVVEDQEIDIQLSETTGTDDEEKVKDVLFLADLFGGVQDEMKTSIKIHITQEDDTVETIAKRYEVSAVQLMKDNNLSPEDINEGLLVIIPKQPG